MMHADTVSVSVAVREERKQLLSQSQRQCTHAISVASVKGYSTVSQSTDKQSQWYWVDLVLPVDTMALVYARAKSDNLNISSWSVKALRDFIERKTGRAFKLHVQGAWRDIQLSTNRPVRMPYRWEPIFTRLTATEKVGARALLRMAVLEALATPAPAPAPQPATLPHLTALPAPVRRLDALARQYAHGPAPGVTIPPPPV